MQSARKSRCDRQSRFALARLREGGDMDAAIGAALAHDERFDFARALVRWLDIGALAEVHL